MFISQCSSLTSTCYPFISLSPPPHRLNLSASVLGKRSRGADEPVPADLPWLTEVHSKIWNQNGLRPQLFRGVVVTEAHYSALQKRLNDLHPDRGSPAYDARILIFYLPSLISFCHPPQQKLRHHDIPTTTIMIRAILNSSHPLSAFWICQPWGLSRGSRPAAYLCHFYFVKNTHTSRS